MMDKKKISKRIAKENKIREMPLLNLYILVVAVLVCIGSCFSISILEFLKPLPMVMMIIYLHQKNSSRQHLVPNLVQAGLVMSLIGDILLMSKEMDSFVVGTVFFFIAHICYVISFCMGDQIRYTLRQLIRYIPPKYIWTRRVTYVIIWLLFFTNVYTLFDKMPNKLLFPLYGIALALMLTSALKRYQFTTPYSFGFIFAGSLLFAISDNLLGFLKFNHYKTDFGRMLIMLTYYAGQYLIMHGSLHHSNLQHQLNQFNKYRKTNFIIL